MANDPHIQDIITRHQVYLERLKTQTVNDVTGELSGLGSAITDVLRALRVKNLNELTKGDLKKLLAKLREAQTEVLMEGVSRLNADLKALADYEAQFEGKALQKVVTDIRIALPSAAAAYQAALDTPLSMNGLPLDAFIKGWTDSQVNAVNNLVRKGWTDGWSNDRMIQAIRGTAARRYTDGLLASTYRNTATIVRTSVQHVASTARFRTWAENADIVKFYRWISTLDSRTTIICQSLDGRVFPLGKGPKPPAHYNCRSTTVAELSKKILKQAGVEPDDHPTYYEWLKKQPAGFQDIALGPTRGKLFRDGGLSAEKFARLNLGRDFQPLTLAEMRKLEPHAFEQAGLN